MSGALNSFGSLATFVVGGRKYRYHSLNAFAETARGEDGLVEAGRDPSLKMAAYLSQNFRR